VPLYRFDLAKCHNTWGIYYGKLGRFQEVEKPFREALACYEQLVAEAPGQVGYREQLAAAHKNLAILFARTGQSAKAVEMYTKARDLSAKLAAEYPQVPHYRYQLSGVYLELASQHRRTGATREANEADRRAVDLLGQLAGAFPKNPVYLRDYAWELATTGDPGQRDAARAIELARHATTLDARHADGWRALGAAYCRAGKWQDAATALERSLERSRGGDGFSWYLLALARWHLGDRAGARQWYDRATAWQQANNPHDEPLQRFRGEVEALFGGDGPEAGPRKEGAGSDR
jgi:tetratricopeptide (TPR) repeat protein